MEGHVRGDLVFVDGLEAGGIELCRERSIG